MTTPTKRILFSGYARVHFVCFQPVYERLRKDPRVEVFLSGGFRSKTVEGTVFSIDGFYDPFAVERDRQAIFCGREKGVVFAVERRGHLQHRIIDAPDRVRGV